MDSDNTRIIKQWLRELGYNVEKETECEHLDADGHACMECIMVFVPPSKRFALKKQIKSALEELEK